MQPDDDLARLPAHDVDPIAAERLRRRAGRVLAEERRLAERPVARAWRLIEPALYVGAAATYLLWALQSAAALYR
jgi:hypothetical protein